MTFGNQLRILVLVLCYASTSANAIVSMSAERIVEAADKLDRERATPCGQSIQFADLCRPSDVQIPSISSGQDCQALKVQMDNLELLKTENLTKKNSCTNLYSKILEHCQGSQGSEAGRKIAENKFLLDKMLVDIGRTQQGLQSHYTQFGCNSTEHTTGGSF